LGHSCRGHFYLFSLYLTPLSPLHGTGATSAFGFKKEGQTCKVKKGANVELDLETRAVLQLALFYFDHTKNSWRNVDCNRAIEVWTTMELRCATPRWTAECRGTWVVFRWCKSWCKVIVALFVVIW
jgi:hypothetical protein